MPIWLDTDNKAQKIPKTHRLLGLDYGQKRVGVALAAPGWTIITPLKIISYQKWVVLAESIGLLAKEYRPDAVIIGYPLHADGTPGKRAQATRDFAKLLLADKVFGTDIPLILSDERRTSLAADSLGANKTNRDSLAAMLILEDYIAQSE